MTYQPPAAALRPASAPPPPSALFPPREQRLNLDDHLTTLLDRAECELRQGPVAAAAEPENFSRELAGFDFDQPVEMRDLLGWTVARLQTGLVHMTHPRYLGLFNPAPSFPARCADRIAASFNPQLASATTSPAATAIEAHTIRAVARRAGLGAAATGHFTAGGSEANFTALICALTRAEPNFAAAGARAFPGQPVFYISADSHLAWIKIAHQAGIGRDAARLVATDGTGRLCLQALAAAITADRAAGHVPVMLVATAGTTNAGMVDPLAGAAALAAANRLWYHVDAAWGGALIASKQLSPLLAGIETADSITIDAHKWFATTMGCGMFLTPHAAILTEAFNVANSFMPSQAAIDPYTASVQWSRRFSGLRLFLSLAAGGWAAHAAHVEQCFALTAMLTDHLQTAGWTAANGPALGVTCMVPPAGAAPAREIVANVVASGAAWVSIARFEGREVMRACVTHGETTAADIAITAAALTNAAGR